MRRGRKQAIVASIRKLVAELTSEPGARYLSEDDRTLLQVEVHTARVVPDADPEELETIHYDGEFILGVQQMDDDQLIEEWLSYKPKHAAVARIVAAKAEADARYAMSLALADRSPAAVTSEAEEAFWDKVAEMLPEAQSGDLDPGIVCELQQSMEAAVARWMDLNLPKGDDRG